jgi:outer membrane protein assembly factor BamB
MFLCLVAIIGWPKLGAQESAAKPGASQALPGLISKAQMDPPLTSRVREIRFSPNGASLLMQDDSMAYVIATNPLAIQLQLAASQLLPMRFSSDSQQLVAATRNMRVVGYKIHERSAAFQKTLGDGKECYAAALSNDGELYACLDDKSELHVFRTRTGEQIFDKTIGEAPSFSFPLPAPYHIGLARSEPFGYFLTPNYVPFDAATTAAMLDFSVDGHYLIARSKVLQQPAELIDLQAKKTIGMPKALRAAADTGTVTFVAPDRAVTTTFGNRSQAELVSFPAGETLGKLDFGGLLRATDNPRYVIDAPFDMSGPKLVDLQTDKPVAQLSMAGNDVDDKLIASYSNDGFLTLTQIGAAQLLVRARTPVSPLPLLRTAAVSPGLEAIAVGIDGNAGVFSASTGKRLAPFMGLSGGWCPNDQICYLRSPGLGPGGDTLESVDLKSGATSNLATLPETPYSNETIASGTVLLSHRVKPPVPGEMPKMAGRSFPYEIHALDPATGKELWQRAFEVDPLSQTLSIKSTPVVYTNPQGDRIVLGWGARTGGGKEAAEHNPAAKNLMKQVKVTDHDSVFEVLDARSGKTIGAAFVQTDSGADTFDSVFSEGDWLVLVKDGRSVSAFSLSTDSQVAQETGYAPAISAEAGLLSVVGDAGHFTILNLKAPAQKHEYTFPSSVAYAHFSADGKRILVMTEDQIVYVLNVAAP